MRFGNLTGAVNKILTPRCYSTTTTTTTATTRSVHNYYIDDWYQQITKPNEFYEQFSTGYPRRYFYNIDLQGRLFLEETSPKNIASSVKDEKFLDFFFSRIRKATAAELQFLVEPKKYKYTYSVSPDDYPFVSRCGSEINFVRPAATPIVFHTLVDVVDDAGAGAGAGTGAGTDTARLLYGGRIEVPFRSDRLAVSKRSGKLYYRITGDEEGNTTTTMRRGEAEGLEYGLICSSVGVALSGKISLQENYDDKFLYDGDAEIDWLPSRYEPGKWAMSNE